jgi:hypothetical protein
VVGGLAGILLVLISLVHGECAAPQDEISADTGTCTMATPERTSWSNPTPQPVLVLADGRALVPAQRPWLDTGLVVKSGQEISVRAQGRMRGCLAPSDDWAFGPWQPDGMVKNGKLFFALVGRIQSGTQEEVFVLGAEGTFTAHTDGPLHLGVCDIAHFDNEGAYLVRVLIDGREIDFNQIRLVPVPSAGRRRRRR